MPDDAEIVVIDYGGGNIGSLLAALERHHVTYDVSSDPARLQAARGAIFPGDGAFGATMDALRRRNLDRGILDFIASGRPFLGICVGMQILFEASTEFGATAGLGIFPGTIERFSNAPRVPHMGWNRIEPLRPHPFIAGLGDDAYAYFLHSYRAPVGEATVATTTHGDRFSSIVAQRNVMGTQFHPEKSRATGRLLLDHFLQLSTSKEATP